MSVAEVPWVGRAEAIALYAFAHALFASFAFGSPLIATFAQWRFRRTGDGRYAHLARDLAGLNVIIFGLAASTAVVVVFVFATFWPSGGLRILSLYFWPVLLIGFLYLLEGALLAYHAAQKGRHLAAGAAASLIGLTLVVNLNSAIAALLAALPYAFAANGGQQLPANHFALLPFDIPGWAALTLYRGMGSLLLTGLLLATATAWLQRRAADPWRRQYLRWVCGRGLRFGLLPLLALPLVGGIYLLQSPLNSLADLASLAVGNLSWAFSLQMVILGTLLLLGDWYLVRALEGTSGHGAEPAREWMLAAGSLALALGSVAALYASSQGLVGDWDAWGVVGLLVAIFAVGFALFDRKLAGAGPEGDWSAFAGVLLPLAGLCAAFVVAPTQVLLGEQFGRTWPWQLAALIGLFTLVLPSAALYLQARSKRLLVRRETAPALLPMLTGLAAVAAVFLLGYVRDVALGSYVLYQQLAANETLVSQASVSTPVAPVTALWLITFCATLAAVLAWQGLQSVRGSLVEETVELTTKR